MKKKNLRVLICIITLNIIVISLLFISNGHCASEEIDSKFGEAPVIDGYIDFSSNEWNKAVKISTSLEDLDIEFWVVHDYSNLYISVQIELEIDAHNATEFVGILISNSSSENIDDFVDTKIIQFSDISENNFTYFDYNINNGVFLPDVDKDGDGAAKLEGKTSTYEFSIPTNTINQEDVLLDYGNVYAFNITYGDIPSYPTGIIKSSIILINIKSIKTTEQPLWDLILFVLIILVFSGLGILFGFYIYKIFKLEGKIERIKR